MSAELLIHIGNSSSSARRDGDIVCAMRQYDALRTHAELTVRGRGRYRGPKLRQLQRAYDDITRRAGRTLPREDDLIGWWGLAERETDLRAADHRRFPFSRLERRLGLVVPLNRDVTLAEKAAWTGVATAVDARSESGRTQLAGKPKFVDWRRDVIGRCEVRIAATSHLGSSWDARCEDVCNPRLPIVVRGDVSDRIIRERK